MYLAEIGEEVSEADVARKAKELGLSPGKAVAKYREMSRELALSPNRMERMRRLLVSARKEHKEALENLGRMRQQAMNVKNPGRRASLLRMMDEEEKRLRRVAALLSEGERMQGLGFAWFGLIMGIVMGAISLAAYVEFRSQVKKTVEETGSAIITLTYVTAIGGGLLMLLYMGKLFRDAYGGDEKPARGRA